MSNDENEHGGEHEGRAPVHDQGQGHDERGRENPGGKDREAGGGGRTHTASGSHETTHRGHDNDGSASSSGGGSSGGGGGSHGGGHSGPPQGKRDAADRDHD